MVNRGWEDWIAWSRCRNCIVLVKVVSLGAEGDCHVDMERSRRRCSVSAHEMALGLHPAACHVHIPVLYHLPLSEIVIRKLLP